MIVVALNFALLFYEIFKPHHSPVPAYICNGGVLIQSFLYGICFFFFRSKIVFNRWLFFASVPLVYFLLSIRFDFFGDFLAPLPIAYLTIYLGLLEPRRLKIVSSGDYSYGIYLFGYPVQQAVVAILGAAGLHWYMNFPLSLLIVSSIAFCSWHFVEKPASKLRAQLFRLEATLRAGALRFPALRILIAAARE